MLARGQEEKDMPKVDVPAVERCGRLGVALAYETLTAAPQNAPEASKLVNKGRSLPAWRNLSRCTLAAGHVGVGEVDV